MTVSILASSMVSGAARLAGLVALAGGIAIVVAAVHRWYARQTVPKVLVILAGLTGVALYLNTTALLGQVIGGTRGLLDLEDALVNTATFLVAGAATLVGRRIGDRLAGQLAVITGARELDADVSRVVRAVGRVISVELPEADDIEDLENYDPVPPETKAAIGGKTLLFPRRLTVDELRARLIDRLKADYGVGHVGLDIADDGTVEFLAVGSRASGLGPTLAPGTCATAIRADPPHAATSGDIVQIWQTGPEPARVTTGELRGTADDVVTLAVDESDATSLSPSDQDRLIPLPAAPRPEHEYASLLRAADETMGVITVHAESGIVGSPYGAIDATVVAVRQAEGTVEAIPPSDRVIADGDTLYVIARPENLRRLESATAAAVES